MQYMLVWVTESWLGTGQALMMPFTARAILTAGLVRWCENCGGNNVISESGHSCILWLSSTAGNGTSRNSTKLGEAYYGLLHVAKIITAFRTFTKPTTGQLLLCRQVSQIHVYLPRLNAYSTKYSTIEGYYVVKFFEVSLTSLLSTLHSAYQHVCCILSLLSLRLQPMSRTTQIQDRRQRCALSIWTFWKTGASAHIA